MKNKFIKSTIILIIGGIITKVLSLIIKIVLTRSITTEALGQYMLLTPTLILIINLSQAGFPKAISKLIGEEQTNNKKVVLSILPIQVINTVFLMILIFVFAKTLSYKLLNNRNLYLGIISMALVVPFTSITSMINGYFLGKSNTLPIILSNTVELLIKLFIYLFYLPIIKNKSISYIICFLIITNVISEMISILILLIFLPKKIDIRKRDFIPKINYLRRSFSISIPTTTSRLIGSIGFFLEPIILTNILTNAGYSTKYISYNYGVITGYVIPLILLPSFFTIAISDALLPNISNDYSKGNIKKVKYKLKLSILFSIIIGVIFTTIFIAMPEVLLKTIYHTNKGTTFLKVLAPIFFLQYLTSPLEATLDAIGKSKINMLSMTISTIIGSLSLTILSFFKIGLWSLIISESLSIIISTIYLYLKTSKYLT